ncbi:MAG: prenyltransferase [Chloroflexota bacterium]|nr:prenyltransferase [Chloroflexota bacterium]
MLDRDSSVDHEEDDATLTFHPSSQPLADDDATATVHSSSNGRKNSNSSKQPAVSSHIVTAESVQAEEVPTIPLESLQTLSTLQPEVAVHSIASTHSAHLPIPLVVQPSEYRRSISEWLQLLWDGMRPMYLLLSLPPVLVGSILAWIPTLTAKHPFGQFHVLHFIALLIAVAFIQIGANLLNDYYDYLTGVDTSNALGPGGLIQQGLIRPANILIIGIIFLVLGGLIGATVAWSGGFLPYLFGLFGLGCAYFYSATSRSLSSLALGELVSFAIFGPLLTLGAYLVQAPLLPRASLLTVLLYSLPLGLLATAAIHVNNMRDAESDNQAQKRTIATLLHLHWNRVLYLCLVLGAYAIVIALGIPHNAPHFILLTLWTLPTLLVAITGVLRADLPPGLNIAMRETLKLLTLFTLLLIIGLIISALVPVLPQIPAHLLPF